MGAAEGPRAEEGVEGRVLRSGRVLTQYAAGGA